MQPKLNYFYQDILIHKNGMADFICYITKSKTF